MPSKPPSASASTNHLKPMIMPWRLFKTYACTLCAERYPSRTRDYWLVCDGRVYDMGDWCKACRIKILMLHRVNPSAAAQKLAECYGE